MGQAESFMVTFEVYTTSVAQVVSLITAAAFCMRSSKKRVWLNLTGALASLLTLFFTTWALTLWFVGLNGISCTVVQVVNGMCLSSSTATAFVHLFLKADASNKLNPRWPVWRWAGIIATILNWVVLVCVHALIDAETVADPALDGEERCKWKFDPTTFKMKWLVQAFNHLLMAGLFCWPLLHHLRHLKFVQKPGASTSPSGGMSAQPASATHAMARASIQLYRDLVYRAVGAMAVSCTYCVVVTGLVIAKCYDASLIIPVYPLAILDNAITLASILMAVDVGNGGSAAARRASISQLEAMCLSNSKSLSHEQPAPKSTALEYCPPSFVPPV